MQSATKALNAASAHKSMLTYNPASPFDTDDSPALPEPLAQDLSGLEELLHLRSHILKTKLEVLAIELRERFQLRDQNVARIDAEKETVVRSLPRLSRQARYHLREPRDNSAFYQQGFNLDEERRSQDVECWQDVARVIRDFLDVWEAHQQATVRGRFLQHAG